MEDAKNNIFRQDSLDRIASPEQLDDYIRISRPGVWVVVIAAIVLLASFLVWGAYGTLPTTIPEVGVVTNGELVCYNADVSGVAPSMLVTIGDVTGRVTHVSATPYSSEEIAARYDSDYTTHMLGIEDWNYEIRISAPGIADGLTEATIITGQVHPITFIFN